MTENYWSRSHHLSPKLHLAPGSSSVTVEKLLNHGDMIWRCTIFERPLHFSSRMLSWPSRNQAYHLYIAVFFFALSPYAFCNINSVSFFESLFKTRNFIESRCSSAILTHEHRAIWALTPKWRHTGTWRNFHKAKISRVYCAKFGGNCMMNIKRRRYYYM